MSRNAADSTWWEALLMLDDLTEWSHEALVRSVLGDGGDVRRVVLTHSLLNLFDEHGRTLAEDVARCLVRSLASGTGDGHRQAVRSLAAARPRAAGPVPRAAGEFDRPGAERGVQGARSRRRFGPGREGPWDSPAQRPARFLPLARPGRGRAHRPRRAGGRPPDQDRQAGVASRPRRGRQGAGRLRNRRAVDTLLEAFRREERGSKRAIAEALGRIGDPLAIETLRKSALQGDILLRSAATEALGRIGAPAVDDLITFVANREDGLLEFWASTALARIGGPAVDPILTALKKSRDWRVKWRLIGILGEIGDSRAIGPLIAELRSASPLLMSRAARTLAGLGVAAVAPLIEQFRGADTLREITVADALVEIGPAAVEPLIATLADADADVRRQAAQTLGKLGDPRAVEPLLGLLTRQDEEALVRARRRSHWGASATTAPSDPSSTRPTIRSCSCRWNRSLDLRWSASTRLST